MINFIKKKWACLVAGLMILVPLGVCVYVYGLMTIIREWVPCIIFVVVMSGYIVLFINLLFHCIEENSKEK